MDEGVVEICDFREMTTEVNHEGFGFKNAISCRIKDKKYL